MNIDDQIAQYHFENTFKGVNIDVEEDTNQRELIEQDLDSQPDDIQLDEFISTLKYPEVIPSYKDYQQWLFDNYQSDLLLIEYQRIKDTKDIEYDMFVAYTVESDDTWNKYQDYVKDYRKQLREWWLIKNKDKYVTNEDGEILFVNGIVERKDHKYQNNDIVDEDQTNGFNIIANTLITKCIL